MRKALRGKVLRPALRATALLFAFTLSAGGLWAFLSVLGNGFPRVALAWGDGCSAMAGCVRADFLALPAGVAIGGLMGLWGALVRKACVMAEAALALGATWLLQVLLLSLAAWREPASGGFALNATQFAAFLLIPASLFLGTAWVLGWRPSPRATKVLALAPFAPPLVVACLYAQGSPARAVPEAPLLGVLLIAAIALGAYGLRARHAQAALLSLALGAIAWAVQSTRFVLLDPELSVALVSYVGPSTLALMPLGLWLLSDAARPLARREAEATPGRGSMEGTQ